MFAEAYEKFSRRQPVSTLVLGAGLTGLSYAYRKLKKNSSSVVVLEKSNNIGGLMKTYFINGFAFDYGPHVFRSRDENVMRFVKNLLKDDYYEIPSNPAIFKYGLFFDNVIPVITYRNIELLPKNKRIKVRNEMEKASRKLEQSNFEDCIISQVGETLYWEFFGEYSKKWWGVEPKNLSSELAPKNIKISKEKSYGHISTSFEKLSEEIYPTEGGIFAIAKALKDEVEKLGGAIMTNSNVKALEYDGNKITRVVVEKDGEEVEINSERSLVVSTIPLTILCKMLKIKNDLLYRGDICIFIKLKGNKMFNYSWIYFHDSDIIFSRIYEPLYYSINNAPKGYTSLCAEVTSFENDKNWKDNNLGEKVVQQLLDLGMIKKSQEPEVLGLVRYAYAYPIYTLNYKKQLENVFEKLNQFKNLKAIGRTGEFSYLNMWECLKWAVY